MSLWALTQSFPDPSNLGVLGGDDDLARAGSGEAVCRREASARRRRRRRLGELLRAEPGHVEVHCEHGSASHVETLFVYPHTSSKA